MDTDGSIPPSALQMFALSANSANSGIPLLVGLFLLFVLLGAYFGGTESAISAASKIRIKSKAEDGDKGAKNAFFVTGRFDEAITTLLVGNNITHIAAASVATLIATKLFGTSDTVTLLCTIVTTLIVFLFSEMLPKALCNDRCDTMACFLSGSLRVLMKILKPITAFFGLISGLATKLSDKLFGKTEEVTITEDELYDIIDTIEEEGVMNEEQGDLFKSALDFSETTVKDVMTMREDVLAIDSRTPNEQIGQIVLSTSHSRIPVYVGNIDHILGIMSIRTFLKKYLENPDFNIRTILMQPYRVKPNAKIDDLLSEMATHRFYLGIVADENKKTMGLVTIEDFLEELVGEIWDEDDVVDKDFIKLGGNYFRVNTHLYLREVYERMDLPLPDQEKADMPVISLLLEVFGKIPEEDDTVIWNGMEISVEDADEHHVYYVVFHPLPDGKEETV